ncbi:hypothetical protein GCM10009107_57390 [Ideonella azotifigens]|uniref:YgjV family protein n=2 Tax=Ideonella azotifigens TaxID=513160 RepID=A0ABN1KIY9_9BURK
MAASVDATRMRLPNLPLALSVKLYFILAQGLAAVSFLLDLASFQIRRKELVLAALSASTCLLAAQYALLDAWASAAMMLLASLRFLVSSVTRSPRVEQIFLFTATAVFVALPLSSASCLAWLGNCIQTHAAFNASDRRMRLQMMLGSGLWIAHNVHIDAWVSVLAEAGFLLSNCVGYYRFHMAARAPETTSGAPAT